MINYNIISKNKLNFIMLILFKLLLDYSYYFISTHINISQLYDYTFEVLPYTVGWIFMFIIYLILMLKKDTPIFFIIFFIFILYVLPNIVYYSLSSQNIKYLVFLILPYLVIILSIKNFNIKKSLNWHFNIKYLIYLSVFLSLLVLINLIYKNQGDYVFNIMNVYDFRRKIKITNLHVLFNYLEPWTLKIFSLFILAYALYTKNFVNITYALFLIIGLYIFTGYKIIILSSILIIYLYFLFKLKDKIFWFLFSLILLFIILLLYTIYFNDLMPASIVIRRLFFMPTMLNFVYIDFFSLNEHIYWSNGILSNIFEYPYTKNIGLVIGSRLELPDMHANTGFVATGYAHFGITGIILYTFIACFLLNIINNLLKFHYNYLKISIVLLPIYTLFVAADLLTTILTHGLFISIFLIFIYNENKLVLNKK